MLSYHERPSWLRLVFAIRGSEFSRIRYRLLAVFCLSMVVTFLHEWGLLDNPITPQVLSLTGLALGVFLGFRNNTSYDRFWEGRKLWGALVNTARAWAREVLTLLDSEEGDPRAQETKKNQIYRALAFVHALRLALRSQLQREELAFYLSSAELDEVMVKLNVPDAILLIMGRVNREPYQAGCSATIDSCESDIPAPLVSDRGDHP